jgi:hypothetical protein
VFAGKKDWKKDACATMGATSPNYSGVLQKPCFDGPYDAGTPHETRRHRKQLMEDQKPDCHDPVGHRVGDPVQADAGQALVQGHKHDKVEVGQEHVHGHNVLATLRSHRIVEIQNPHFPKINMMRSCAPQEYQTRLVVDKDEKPLEYW